MLINNHLEIIATLYIVFAVFSTISVFIKIAQSRKITIMNMCSIMYVLLLGVVPAIILLGYTDGSKATKGIVFEESTVWTFYLQLVLTIVAYLFFCFGYKIKQKETKLSATYAKSKTLPTSVIFSVLSLVSLFLWASGYGGVGRLIANANSIRAGWLSSSNSFTFFKHFVPLSLLASWMLFNMLIRKEAKGRFGKISVLILLLCNFALSSIYIQANDGRLLLAAYVLIFLLLYIKYQYETKRARFKSMLLKLGVVFIAVVFILFNADSILHTMRNESYASSSDSNIVDTISKEFSFIISGAQNALFQGLTNDGKLMISNDVVNGIFAWLPTSLKPIILEDVWDYNTRIINVGGHGQSPTSIVAQSVYDLSLSGIIIIPFIYGILIKKIENVLEKRKGNVFYDTVYVALGYYLCKGIPYFSIYNIMMNTFFIVVAVLIYNAVQKIKLR